MIFHQSIGFPSYFRAPVGEFVLDFTRHALDRAREKGFDIPDKIVMRDFKIIEIEITNHRLNKMVVRGEYDEYDDICLVLMPRFGRFVVKTAWLNAWNDQHKTLDESKYAKP